MKHASTCSWLAAVVFLTALSAAPAADPQKHEGMFRTGPVKTMPIYDPRYSRGTVTYMLIDGNVVVDGDLVLGTEEDVLKRSWRLAVKTAKEAQSRPEALKAFAADQKSKLTDLAKSDPEVFPKDLKALTREVEFANEVLQPLKDLRKPETRKDLQQQAFVIFAGASGEFLWPEGVISYAIDVDVPDETRNLIRDAMKHWTDKTNVITFKACDPKQTKDFVRFVKGGGCYSEWVGKKGGEQKVGLSGGCEKPQVIHEIGHVVGLFHEQNRLDRESHLKVDAAQMKPGAADQFNRSIALGEDNAKNSGPFDWKSIMLYPPKAFTATGKQTLVRKDAENDTSWGLYCGETDGGVTKELSDGDVAAVRLLYKGGKGPKQ